MRFYKKKKSFLNSLINGFIAKNPDFLLFFLCCISISVKYINCKMKGFQKKCESQTDILADRLTYGQSDSKISSAPKKGIECSAIFW